MATDIEIVTTERVQIMHGMCWPQVCSCKNRPCMVCARSAPKVCPLMCPLSVPTNFVGTTGFYEVPPRCLRGAPGEVLAWSAAWSAR
eukprot:5624936-Lingulodinium_polyedra.AAC.1